MTIYTRRLWLGLMLFALLALSACRGEGETAVMTIGDRLIYSAEARYVLDIEADLYEYSNMHELDWEGETDGIPTTRWLLERARNTMIRAYVLEAKAAEYGCELTGQEQAQIEAYMESDRQNGPEAFAAALKAAGTTEELYRRYQYEEPMLYTKVCLALFDPGGVMEPDTAVLQSFYQDNMVHCLYLYLSLTDIDGFRMKGEEYDRMVAIAGGLHTKALRGADFAEMVASDGQDGLMFLYPNGLPIVKTLYGDAFAQAVESLSPYEISPVIETHDGLMIIQRLPDDEALFEQYRAEIEEEYVQYAYAQWLAQWLDEAGAETTDAYWQLTSRRAGE